MRIMTNNIWGDYFGNEVSFREEQIFKVFKKYSADVIGLQEVTAGWYKSNLFKNLSEEYMLIGTELFDNENFVPIVIKKNHTLIAKGYEKFDNLPSKAYAITWAVVKAKEGKFAVCNTHFWYMQGNEPDEDKRIISKAYGEIGYFTKEQHNEVRNNSARQLANLMKWLNEKYSCPVFAFGDMNTTTASDVFKVYKEKGVKNLLDEALKKDMICTIHGNPERKENGRFHGKRTTMDYTMSIDHIIGYGDGYSVKEYRIVEDQDVLDATDHSPVYADIEF